MEPNPEIRSLNAMHDSNLEHGRGRIWCLSCHDLDNRNYLKTLLNELVDFDEAYLVCGGCHANRHKDWSFGAHGKRLANWQGERTQYSCPQCHDPHSPAIKLRAPKPAPPVRAGLILERGAEHEKSHVWDSQEEHEEP
jgi:Zn finger protein HypA/HybF involved in hydrogenase expression